MRKRKIRVRDSAGEPAWVYVKHTGNSRLAAEDRWTMAGIRREYRCPCGKTGAQPDLLGHRCSEAACRIPLKLNTRGW